MAGRLQVTWRAARAVALVLALALAHGVGGAAFAQDEDEELHIINMRNADIHAFIEDVTAVTGYTFIPHPEVQGRVTVTSQTPLTRDEVFEVFLATLRNSGYAVIPASSGSYRIVPEDDAAENTGVVGDAAQRADQFVTEVIPLNHIDAAEAARIVTPLVNHRGQVTASGANNVLIVVDYAGNIERIREVLRDLDQDRSIVATVALDNASAYEVAQVVNELDVGGGGESGSTTLTAVALDSANSVLLRGDPSAVARARDVIGRLDVESRPTETLRVMRLQHARAEDVVPVLEAVARAAGPKRGNVDSITIPFDEATNSIVLTADPQTLNTMVRVVQELDVRRAQVRVEAIIVELSDDLSRDLGVQYLLAGKEDGEVPFAVTNFSRSAPNLLAITGALTVGDGEDENDTSDALRDLAVGSLLGIEGGAIGFGGENDDGLFGIILNAVQNDDNSNVLSTPSITMLDNEPARIMVGQEIPITTGEALSANNTNPFRTIERQDVGVQLEVQPQINDGDTIQVRLRQEVSSVAGAAGPTLGELITNKRELETTALADNGEVLVIGGLIENSEIESVSKVPLLGDIPGLGRAFSSRGRLRNRKNLMVFIRCTIVRDAASARAMTADSARYVSPGGAAAPGARDFNEMLRDTLGEVSAQDPGR